MIGTIVVAHDGSDGSARVAHDVDADLLVCGTRGRGGVAGLVLGSVARELPAEAHRPVTVVPNEGRREWGKP